MFDPEVMLRKSKRMTSARLSFNSGQSAFEEDSSTWSATVGVLSSQRLFETFILHNRIWWILMLLKQLSVTQHPWIMQNELTVLIYIYTILMGPYLQLAIWDLLQLLLTTECCWFCKWGVNAVKQNLCNLQSGSHTGPMWLQQQQQPKIPPEEQISWFQD